MHFPRLLPLLAALLLLFATGCVTTPPAPRYTKLRVTDQRGILIAEWTAKGRVSATDDGYRITAVERWSAPPYPVYTRYPNGWQTRVVGPHIERWRCGEPLWLYRMESGEASSFSK